MQLSLRYVLLALSISSALPLATAFAGSAPTIARDGLVVSQEAIAAEVGAKVLEEGGNAVDAAVATAFALAVTHPAAGNLGGGGFLLYRSSDGAETIAYDFRETAPRAATPEMWLEGGNYDPKRHHDSHLAVGVPGTPAGLHLAWSEHGSLPWARLVDPAIELAERGFPVSFRLAETLRAAIPRFRPYPASMAQFTRDGQPIEAGEILKQPELAETLKRIRDQGPAGFYEGKTAELIEQEMQAHGGLIDREDLRAYRVAKREPVRGTYRGYEVIGMPPPSSGGVAIIAGLNVLEGYDLKELGPGSAAYLHRYAETMRRVFADRARWIADPDFAEVPIERLISRDYASKLRETIRLDRASKSDPTSFDWPHESDETTHLSVVDKNRNAVALTYTLEYSYGSGIVVPGAGFLLNNELGDFNAAPGLTTATGLIGTPPNLAAPGKRPLSSMSPTIVARDGKLFMALGSPGGRTIINTTLQTIVNVVDFEMNGQEAVDYGRIHHQWLADRIVYERRRFSPDTLALLKELGHELSETGNQGAAQVIVVDPATGYLHGGADRRDPDSLAAGN
ncbi:MAG TPA: gamma-glutamyltransferase [Pirellulaceae bacterium]|jgi:gamma-glutamyltranspeptidase/glutathione hydrolase|nr:gamma-glutamyltransferase [Pirellulaceae bacterium]